jgi:hypothetical protein
MQMPEVCGSEQAILLDVSRVLRLRNLRPIERILFLSIAAAEEEGAVPCVRDLAKSIDCALQTARIAARVLETRGLIKINRLCSTIPDTYSIVRELENRP